MKISWVAILYLIVLPFVVVAQNKNNEKSYKHMEGKLGESIEVKANFIRLFNKIEGNYQYRYYENKDSGVICNYGRVIELSGEIYDNDSVRFKELGSGDYSLKGEWGNNYFRGKWSIPDDDNYMDILLKEYYPENSFKFDVFYLQSEQKLVHEAKDSPLASIELVLLYPKDGHFKKEVKDTVEKYIVKNFFGNDFEKNTPEMMMLSYENNYYELYSENHDYWIENKGASFNWVSMNSMSVLFNSENLLCLEYQKYAFTGGAHGMENISYDIFDTKNGLKLNLKNIFNDNADSLLTNLITGYLIEKYKAKFETNLKDIGFFVDKVKPNENIYLTGNGIGFQYSSYEIAPYSFGLPNVFLEFDKIKDLIKKNSPVYDLISK
jgi:hypothetical protein